ncbi:MAG: hypothetical protein V3T05_00890 [Myxococcota bacterium]
MIKAKNVRDVRELIASKRFTDWFARYDTLYRNLQELRQHDADAVVRAVLQAGEYEGQASAAEATFAELDSSFEYLGEYERQRHITSDCWVDLGRLEYLLAEDRQEASELRAELAASRKRGDAPNIEVERARLENELETAETAITELAAQVEEAQDNLDIESKRRDELWGVVEEMWMTAFRANMARIEYDFLAKRSRAEVDVLAREHAAHKSDGGPKEEDLETVEKRTAEAEQEIVEALEEADGAFECAAIAEFLYWPQEDDRRGAVCVPLVGDRDHLNLQVDKLQVYRVDRNKGLKSIEPLPDLVDSDDDVRLDAFFAASPA